VKVSRVSDFGRQLILGLYGPDEFFGESIFLPGGSQAEEAVAVQSTKVMGWSIVELEAIINKKPRLGIALLQLLVERVGEYRLRMLTTIADTTSVRLARSLVHLAEKLGSPRPDGFIQMMPLTHDVLAQYVGTSREIVTTCMNEFRRDGYVRYSRTGIAVNKKLLTGWLEARARGRHPGTGELNRG
jgi:CRP/FNR family transcriptional regulator